MGGTFLSNIEGNLEAASILLAQDMNGHPEEHTPMGKH